MELVTKKQLELILRSGPSRARPGGRRPPRDQAHRGQPRRLRQQRDPVPLRRLDPGRRRVHHAEPRRAGERLDHGAADHDRRRQAGVGQAHHRRVPLLRLRPPGPQGRGPRAHHGQARHRHAGDRRRRSHRRRRPALEPDPGVLRRALRPPHGRADARSTTCGDTSPATSSWSPPTPAASRWPSATPSDLDADLATIYKRRTKGKVNLVEALGVMGEVKGRNCVLIDEMIDSGGTIVAAIEMLKDQGAEEIWCSPPTVCCQARRSIG